ncbi:MAG: receptor binding protein [Caudoviricetes sp.]|nr:MAG: receptor binding protein [Caudoviricetes sp.]
MAENNMVEFFQSSQEEYDGAEKKDTAFYLTGKNVYLGDKQLNNKNIELATTETNGLMSKEDKIKVDEINEVPQQRINFNQESGLFETEIDTEVNDTISSGANSKIENIASNLQSSVGYLKGKIDESSEQVKTDIAPSIEQIKIKLEAVEGKAGVTGVKGSSETDYRKGNVNISKENIGLDKVDNTADVDKKVAQAEGAVKIIKSSTDSTGATKGSAIQPVYLKDGVLEPGTHTINSNVPANAKFTDTTYGEATTSAAGLMSAADKTKLNGIATGAQVNTITGVKGEGESTYRTGNINLTAENLASLPVKYILYNATTKETALKQLDNPNLLFNASANRPYCILFQDDIGDSPLGGGRNCIYGYIYENGNYGAQIAMRYSSNSSRLKIRNLNVNTWSNWSSIYDTTYKPTPADIGAVAKTGSTMTGKLVIDGEGIGLIPPKNLGGHARGIHNYSNPDMLITAGIGFFGSNGNINHIYSAVGTDSPWDKDKGLTIEQDNMLWKNVSLTNLQSTSIAQPATGSVYTELTSWYANLDKNYKTVTLNISIGGEMASVSDLTTLCTIPEGYKPKRHIFVNYSAQNGTPMLLDIQTNGIIRLFNNNNAISNIYFCRQCITYLTA